MERGEPALKRSAESLVSLSRAGISDNYIWGASTCTQKPGMPRSVESRPLGDDRGGHWPRMIKRRENLAEITGNVRYRFEKKKRYNIKKG